jgi:hypothetical protein
MCYLSVYGSKNYFEAKVPVSICNTFSKYNMDRHKAERASLTRDEFATAIRANPMRSDGNPVADGGNASFKMFGLDDGVMMLVLVPSRGNATGRAPAL